MNLIIFLLTSESLGSYVLFEYSSVFEAEGPLSVYKEDTEIIPNLKK